MLLSEELALEERRSEFGLRKLEETNFMVEKVKLLVTWIHGSSGLVFMKRAALCERFEVIAGCFRQRAKYGGLFFFLVG